MIVVYGEGLIDLFVEPDGTTRAVPGGGPLNVARTAARLGQPTTLFARLSDDHFGRLLRAHLEADGVRLGVPAGLDSPTAIAVVEQDAEGPRYRFHLHGTATFDLDQATTLAVAAAMEDRVAALHVGTLSLVVEPMAATVEAAVAAADPSTVVLVDPNCRAGAVDDEGAYRRRLSAVLRRADVAKVSVEDLAYLYPALDLVDAVSGLLDAGPACVLVTAGADQAQAWWRERSISVPVPTSPVVDTVGAGDAFGGAFLAWWTGHNLSRADLHDAALVERAVTAAVVVASRTCARAGADPPWASELDGGLGFAPPGG